MIVRRQQEKKEELGEPNYLTRFPAPAFGDRSFMNPHVSPDSPGPLRLFLMASWEDRVCDQAATPVLTAPLATAGFFSVTAGFFSAAAVWATFAA